MYSDHADGQVSWSLSRRRDTWNGWKRLLLWKAIISNFFKNNDLFIMPPVAGALSEETSTGCHTQLMKKSGVPPCFLTLNLHPWTPMMCVQSQVRNSVISGMASMAQRGLFHQNDICWLTGYSIIDGNSIEPQEWKSSVSAIQVCRVNCPVKLAFSGTWCCFKHLAQNHLAAPQDRNAQNMACCTGHKLIHRTHPFWAVTL